MENKTIKSYQKEVLSKYKNEKGGELRGYLAAPTRSQIRDACVYLFHRRNEKNDEYILNRFFQFKNDENKLREIENFGEGKFRSIENFLKGEVENTSAKNLNLIGWLIDFNPRPYEEYLKSDNSVFEEEPLNRPQTEIIDKSNDREEKVKKEEKKTIEEIEKKRQEEKERKKHKEEEEKRKKKKRRKLVITISIAFGAILITTVIFNKKIFPDVSKYSPSINTTIKSPMNPKIDTQLVDNKCMTWADSLYIPVSCDESPISKYGTQVKPLDPMELKNMHKVEVDAAYLFFSEDGKPLIWYYKNKEHVYEYFTAPGLHPSTGETLRKITPYIIQNYVPKHSNKKESFVAE